MKPAVAIVVDGACVVAFAMIGRASHAEALDLSGLARTAAPFLAGMAIGTSLGRTWRRPLTLASGIAVWVGTLVGGMLLRALTGGGVATSFVIVAGITLAVFLLGWRLVVSAVSRRRQPMVADHRR